MTRLLAVLTLAATGCTPLQVAAVQHHTRLVHDMDRLAQCESGDTNDGGGPYYGHWQFSLPTWRSVGGTGRPDQHPRHVQLDAALRLHAREGWRPWPTCARRLGLAG